LTVRGAALSIDVSITEENSLLKLRHFLSDELIVIKGQLRKSELEYQLSSLRRDLLQFKEELGPELWIQNSRAFSEAIRYLHRCGQVLAWELLDGNLAAYEKIRELFYKTCPQGNRRNSPVIIELEAGINESLPLELLPIFDLTDPPELIDLTDCTAVIDVLGRFLGFSSIIKRCIRGVPQIPIGTKLDNTPKLPVKVFHDSELDGAKYEVDFFQQNSEFIDLEGPWPNQVITESRFAPFVANHLWNPSPRFNGTNRDPMDQVQHFACHCDTSDDNSDNFFISLAHEGYSNKVSIRDLNSRFMNLLASRVSQPDTDLPLVFFNACGSSVIYPTRNSSFPRFFLRNRNRAFIGTETNVPDTVAAAFSRQFYIELLRGCSVGQALYSAKWKLVERYNNPLGIVYMLYGDSDIKVRTPILPN
jgi:hypothetical protein